MTKAQFVELVQAAGNYSSKAAAETAINAFTEAAHTAPKFKAGKTLKDSVAG